MKNIVTIIMFCLFLILTGCDNSKTVPVGNGDEGNMTAKKETLSSENKEDIQSDLISLNAIINSANTNAEALTKELIKVGRAGDNAAVKTVLEKSKKLIDSTNQSLSDLNLKSNEIQQIRLGIYQGNKLVIKFYDLYLKENKTKEENEELAQLQRQSMELQKSFGAKLDQLNKEYKVQ